MKLSALIPGLILLLGPARATLAGYAPPVSRDQARAWITQYYDPQRQVPLDTRIRPEGTGQGFYTYRLTFRSIDDSRVPGLLFVPFGAKQQRSVPLVLLLHGHGNSKDDFGPAIPFLAATGRAALALDAPLSGERAKPGQDIYSADIHKTRRLLIQHVVEWRRALDIMEHLKSMNRLLPARYRALPKIDFHRLSLIGGSMGGILGSVLMAVEPRIRGGVMIVAGGDWGTMLAGSQQSQAIEIRKESPEITPLKLAKFMQPVDPLTYTWLLRGRPKLFINGKKDDVVPVAAGKQLIRMAGRPEQVVWYNTGHHIPVVRAGTVILAWLDRKGL